MRINAQLIDAKNGQHLWAENYDRDFKDIFEIQDEITMKIVTVQFTGRTFVYKLTIKDLLPISWEKGFKCLFSRDLINVFNILSISPISALIGFEIGIEPTAYFQVFPAQASCVSISIANPIMIWIVQTDRFANNVYTACHNNVPKTGWRHKGL